MPLSVSRARNLSSGRSVFWKERSYERFDENGDLTDKQTRQRLRRFIEALYEWTEGLARARLVEKESVR